MAVHRYAVVDTDTREVLNIILWDPDADTWTPGPGRTRRNVEELEGVDIGGTLYADGTYEAPAVLNEPAQE